MSGVRRIIASQLKLLADNPIVGPVPTSQLVTASSTTGLANAVTTFTASPISIPIPHGIGTVFTDNLPFVASSMLPPNPSGGLNPVSLSGSSVTNPGWFTIPGLTYGVVEVEWTFAGTSNAAAAPTFGGSGVCGQIFGGITITDNFTSPLSNATANAVIGIPIVTWAGGPITFTVTAKSVFPYNPLRTFVAVQCAVASGLTGADNAVVGNTNTQNQLRITVTS